MANKIRRFLDIKGLATLLKLLEKRHWKGTSEAWLNMTDAERDRYTDADISDDEFVTNHNILFKRNASVAVTDWVADTTYTDFPWKADIPVLGVTEDYSPDVRMKYVDIKEGIIGPVADATDNKVTIYASAKPTADFVIPVIICTYMNLS